MQRIATIIAVLCGGASGAVCRFKLNAMLMSGLSLSFPLGILCINVLGGLLMGMLQGAVKRSGKPFTVGSALLGTGFLGGFTTFSTFSLDTFTLYHSGNLNLACLNALLNGVFCICAVWAGYRVVCSPAN